MLDGKPAIRELYSRKMGQLGDKTAQRAAIEGTRRDEAELLVAATALRVSRAAARAAPRAPTAAPASPRPKMPTISRALVGTRVDSCWDLTYERTDGSEFSTLRWCAGTIADVKLAARRQPARIFIKFDDGSESAWLQADRAAYWNKFRAGAWRYEKQDEDADADEEDTSDLVDAPVTRVDVENPVIDDDDDDVWDDDDDEMSDI